MTPIAFTEMNIKRAPATAGIYALYRDGDVIYYGHAVGGQATIQSRLKDHIAGRDIPGTRAAMAFTWESCPEPAARSAALLAAFEELHRTVPRWNAAPP
jgi:hypothetical protein